MLGNHKTFAEINLGALKYNYKKMRDEIKRSSADTEMICVLKADAYGHGAKNCCRALLEEGCRFFAVSSIEEAIDLREVCEDMGNDAEILILGYTFPYQAALLAKYNIITSLVDRAFALELADEAKRAGVKVRCHLKIDTGMNRIGFLARGVDEIESTARDIAELTALRSLDICGMFTHFAKADEALEEELPHEPTRAQAERFFALDKALLNMGIDVKFRHLCNSSAAMIFPEYHLDACRLGISLYGAHPSRYADRYALKPVMKLCTVISHIHDLPAGQTVSYGGVFASDTDRKIATIPIGYADGFVRAYSGVSLSVVTSTTSFKAPVCGRICMDQCMIDVTDTDAAVGDRVVIFGNSPEDLAALAAAADTIEYECLCLVTSRVPRIAVE